MVTARAQESGVEDSLTRQAQEAAKLIISSGISFRLWRLYEHAWLICLVFPLLSTLQKIPLDPLHFGINLAALVIFASVYTWLMWPHPLSRLAQARTKPNFLLLILLAVLTIFVLVFSLVEGSAWLWLFVGVSAIAGATLSVRQAFGAVILLTLLTLFLSLALSGGVTNMDWLHILPLVLLVRGLGLDMIGIARLSTTLWDLHLARGELARLAVMEERVRLARDLHDLLGHNLSLITLKSELASRLVEKEPIRATQEIHEIEQLTRQTLREVREAVAGYRQPTLSSELEGARQLLEAAGIEYSIEGEDVVVEQLPPALDVALAWTVREGVTNVIRHNRARLCLIRFKGNGSTVQLEMINQGKVRPKPEEGAYPRSGNGLLGLGERLSTLGGRLESGPLPLNEQSQEQQFRLCVELPLPNQPVIGKAGAGKERRT
ncbi:MAG TPA: histidine kinase [Chloroflexia bacterium]|nr:histidine kinase [Chloroflexia bacterium]